MSATAWREFYFVFVLRIFVAFFFVNEFVFVVLRGGYIQVCVCMCVCVVAFGFALAAAAAAAIS